MYAHSDRICCLHATAANVCEPITPFTDATLAKAKEVQEIRRTQQARSKYANITLPVKADGFTCYHRSCYASYIAIKKNRVKY